MECSQHAQMNLRLTIDETKPFRRQFLPERQVKEVGCGACVWKVQFFKQPPSDLILINFAKILANLA